MPCTEGKNRRTTCHSDEAAFLYESQWWSCPGYGKLLQNRSGDRDDRYYDDIDLEPGQLRIRKKGSAGGHNGIKHIIQQLGTQTFVRIKVGVGAKPKGWDLADHVLGRFGSNERKLVEEAQERACKAVEMILADSVDAAMNQFNKKMENV